MAAESASNNDATQFVDLRWDAINLDSSMAQCFHYAERIVDEKIRWYRRKKRSKQLFSKLLRAFAILFGVAGGICPVIGTLGRADFAKIGYISLGVAGGLVLFDKLFGISSGWMRFMMAASQLEYARDLLLVDWAETLIKKEQSTNETHVHEQLCLIKEFIREVHRVIINETSDWVAQFEKGLVNLENIALQRSRPSQDMAHTARSHNSKL